MVATSTTLVKEYWFDELGCGLGDFAPGQVCVVSHGTMQGYSGVLFFKYNQACVVSAPESLVPMLTDKTKAMDADTCFNVQTVSSLLGNRLDRIIGPAWIGQIEKTFFTKTNSDETRLLSDSDWKSLEDLLKDCSREESAHSALEVRRSPTVGIFSDKKLVAAAGYEVLAEKVAHVGVLVHPNYRGKGLANRVVSGITEIALQSNLGVQYRTLCTNVASIGAARKIGFQDFADTIAARIR